MIIKYDNKAVKYTNKWVSIGNITSPEPLDQSNKEDEEPDVLGPGDEPGGMEMV